MVQQWRRTPPGKVMQMLTARRQGGQAVRFRQDLMRLEPDEFEYLLRQEQVSDKMIQQELAIFITLKEEYDTKASIAERRLKRSKRHIGEELTEYTEAELRRTLGVAADDIIKEMREDDDANQA